VHGPFAEECERRGTDVAPTGTTAGAAATASTASAEAEALGRAFPALVFLMVVISGSHVMKSFVSIGLVTSE
jgi:hypothetical protein